MVERKIYIKKDQHAYSNCYELRSRAIKKHPSYSNLAQLELKKLDSEDKN